MPDLASRVYVSYAGVLSQLAGAVLLTALFLMLRRYSRRRRYFRVWGQAWVALSIATAALAAVYGIYRMGPPRLDMALGATALYFVFQYFKLVFLTALVAGALIYVRGPVPTAAVRAAPVLLGAYALVTVGLAVDERHVVTGQAPAVICGYVASAWLLLAALPRSRRSLGSQSTGLAFSALAVLWLAILLAGALPRPGPALEALALYRPYLNLLLHALLGYCMVVLVMEHAKREVDDAHAELAVAHDRLKREAYLDPMTETLNRRAFLDGVGLEAAGAGFGTVAMVDVDDLKLVNDAWGHAAGDALLRRLVEALRPKLRSSDKLYRWGGDEFIAVLPGAGPSDARRKLQELIAQAEPLRFDGADPPFSLRASIGCARFSGAEDMPRAVAAADEAMYRRKTRRAAAEAGSAETAAPA